MGNTKFRLPVNVLLLSIGHSLTNGKTETDIGTLQLYAIKIPVDLVCDLVCYTFIHWHSTGGSSIRDHIAHHLSVSTCN